jgi:hypothetical protein
MADSTAFETRSGWSVWPGIYWSVSSGIRWSDYPGIRWSTSPEFPQQEYKQCRKYIIVAVEASQNHSSIGEKLFLLSKRCIHAFK